ncbi:hypothetical protein Tco_1110091 [Tanacetum coccineum]|uniref:Uncharacterized protein n=1 Tax=Tanacetum coccineum TaxID=301880 RepID=A0ABQ5IHY9_9ASTR
MVDRRRKKRKWIDDQFLCHNPFESLALVERFLALGWHLEEIHLTWAHLEKKWMRLRTCTKIHQEVLFSKYGDGVAGIKRRRRDLSGDGVWILATASQHSRLKVDLELST